MLVVIEGNIGIGKSTFLEKLKNRYVFTPIIQSFENYDFISKFHSEKTKYAIVKDMVFMLMDYFKLQEELPKDTLFISDFSFEKSLLFAEIDLSEFEYCNVFLPCYEYLKQNVPKTEATLYLKGNESISFDRVKKRNREIEKNITKEYLLMLQQKYNYFSENYFNNCLKIDCTERDLLNFDDFKHTINEIETYLPQIKKYINE
jgi:deoxyadenosine/deoxycytidine kinase